MTRTLLALIATTMCLSATTTRAQSPANIEVQFKTAQAKADVEGDLKGAIALYERLAKSADRSIAARALIRMAECYRKLGDTEARRIYERLVRDYSDQKDVAAMARAQLGNPGLTVRGDRAVWTGSNVDGGGRVSPDGRLISFVDWQLYDNVSVHDLTTNTDRLISANKSWEDLSDCDGSFSAISPDGKQVAYGCWVGASREVHINSVAGGRPSRKLLTVSRDEVRFIGVRDWSPDGRLLAISSARTDGTSQILLATVADGSSRVLKTTNWKGADGMFFSRDSRHVAFDLPAGEDGTQRDVYVLTVDGSREIAAVVHAADDRVAGWSPDGRYLLFSSDRTGSTGLWGQPFADGNVVGQPELLKAHIGPSSSLGLDKNGALYMHKLVSSLDLKTAPIDLAAGALVGPTVHSQDLLPRPETPTWSPDGKLVAYVSRGSDELLAIRSPVTGAVRRLPRKLLNAFEPQWSPDGRWLIVSGRDGKGQAGLFRIDVASGDVTLIRQTSALFSKPVFSPDGAKIYFRDQRRSLVYERDLATGNERQLLTLQRSVRNLELSPDGRTLAIRLWVDPSSQSSSILLASVETGESRELLRLSAAEVIDTRESMMAWTPDGRGLVVAKKSGGRKELCLVDIETGRSRTLNIDISDWKIGDGPGGFALSRDGRSIAFLTGKSSSEVWAMENFLPAQTGKK